MALSGSALGSLIDTNLASAGANGSNRTVFCNGVGAGVVMSLVGKSFATSDTGSTTGSGVGSGTGITGLVSSAMTSAALAVMPTTGSNAHPMMTAIMNGVVDHLSSSATLASINTPVYAGVGTIVVGSIPVVISEMAGNIQSQLMSAGANGSNLAILCTAIATGVCTGILSSGTGIVTITGSPVGTPSPGSGSGTGVIS
jgi:hypothetical protein